MSEFVKAGSKVFTRPTGIDYELEPGVTYVLKWDDWNGNAFLELGNNLVLPENYYHSEADSKFISKVLRYFESTPKCTTGVMLKGLKGAGKSVCAKKIALDSNLPIIVVDPGFPARRLNEFCNKFEQHVCMLFDELEKNDRYWKTDDLLTFLDGISATCKKLVIFTCNSDADCCDFMKDRCSRVRYSRTFDAMSEAAVLGMCKRELSSELLAKEAAAFISLNFKTVSYDNVLSFIEEIKLDEDVTIADSLDEYFQSVVENLNIYKIGKK